VTFFVKPLRPGELMKKMLQPQARADDLDFYQIGLCLLEAPSRNKHQTKVSELNMHDYLRY